MRNYIFSDENNTESLQEFSDARSDIDITEELPHDDASTQPKTPSPTKEALLPTEPSTPTSSSTSQEKINLEVASITSTMQPTPITDLESVKKLLLGNNDSMRLFSDYSKNIQLQAQDISNLVENIMNMNKMNNESPPLPTVLSEKKTPLEKPEASKVMEAPVVKAVPEKIATPPIVEEKSIEVELKSSSPVKATEVKPATPEKTQKRQAPRPPDQVKKKVEVVEPTAEVKPNTSEVIPTPPTIEEKAPELPPKPLTSEAQNQTKSPQLPPKPKTPDASATAEVKPKVPEAAKPKSTEIASTSEVKPIASEVLKQKTPETEPKASDPPALEKLKTPEAVAQPKLPEAAKPTTPEAVASVSPPKQQSPVQQNAEAPIAAEEVISLTPELKRKAPQPPKEQPAEVKPAPPKSDAKEEAKPATSKARSPSPSDDSLGEDDLVSDKLNTLKRRPKGKIMTASGNLNSKAASHI